jgi:predicted DNA-binding protein
MARRKVTTTVYLEAEQDRLLKALSERTGVTVAAYIREGVDRVLAAHQEHLPDQLRLFDPAQLDLFRSGR